MRQGILGLSGNKPPLTAWLQISEGFDRISILVDKVSPKEREERYKILQESLNLQPDEQFSFKGFGTFMKLHGWEQTIAERVTTTNDEQVTSGKSVETSTKKWNIWRREGDEWKLEVELRSVADFSDYFTKFKSDLSFSELSVFDGFVLCEPEMNVKTPKYAEVAYFELPLGGILRAKSIFKDLILCLLNKGIEILLL